MTTPPAWRTGREHGRIRLSRLAVAALLVLLCLLPAAPAALAAPSGSGERSFLCDGEPLLARLENGAVDAVGIPNTAAGTVPGAFVVLRWRNVSLQLPRTNNAGAPSYTDGQWWWSLEDPDHPRFRRQQGDVQDFACVPAP
jgi:hypothetical protein